MDNLKSKLIIFDCDGVLVDSEILAHSLGVQALASYNYHLTIEESIRKFTGLGSQKAHELIYKESGISIPQEFLANSCFNAQLTSMKDQLKPLVPDFLEQLHACQIKRCVASNSPRERIIRSLEITDQIQFFDSSAIFSAQQVKKGKPSPELFLLAAEKMNFAPQDCIVIEDSPSGIQAAKAAHMNVIGFLGGTHAQFNWYQEMIKEHAIPLAFNATDIINTLFSLVSL